MIELPITKDITKYKPKLLLGLTTRQVICTVLALVAAVPLFLIMDKIFIRDFTFFVCMALATPFVLCGFVHPYDMNFETYFLIIIRSIFLSPSKRKYIQKNMFENLFDAFDDEGNLIKTETSQKSKSTKKTSSKTTPVSNKQVSSDPDLFCCN